MSLPPLDVAKTIVCATLGTGGPGVANRRVILARVLQEPVLVVFALAACGRRRCDGALDRVSIRSVAAVVGAVLTYIGAGLLLFMGLSLLLFARDGVFLGQPTDVIRIAGAPVPMDAAPAVGVVSVVVGLALVVLAVAAQRGRPAGRRGLTVIGGLAMAGLVYTLFTADDVSPLLPMAWIATALILLWLGKKRTNRSGSYRGTQTGHAPPRGK